MVNVVCVFRKAAGFSGRWRLIFIKIDRRRFDFVFVRIGAREGAVVSSFELFLVRSI